MANKYTSPTTQIAEPESTVLSFEDRIHGILDRAIGSVRTPFVIQQLREDLADEYSREIWLEAGRISPSKFTVLSTPEGDSLMVLVSSDILFELYTGRGYQIEATGGIVLSY